MTIMRKVLAYDDNFRLWKNFEIMNEYKNIIITFIDNDILEKDKELFKEIYHEYKEKSSVFYHDVNSILKHMESDITSWDLDFINRKATLTYNENNCFDIDTFVLKNLKLLEHFEKQVKSLLEE